jgi:hypothetical protein
MTASPHAIQQGSPITSRGAAQIASNLDVRVEQRSVRFALSVTNSGRKNVELRFPSGQTHDFVVVDSVGREVWRWGDGRLFTQGLQNKNLAGGKTMKLAEQWEEPARHGRYTAVATLISANYPVQQRVDFVLP